MYEAPSTTGEVLAKILRDVLTRMCVNPMTKLSGFSFDGAANMSGAHRGVKARLQEDVPTALHVPCTNHSLDLVLQEASREVALVADCIQLVKDIANVINDSAKRGNMFRSMFGNNEAVRKLLGVCATRWCVRATAMERLIEQYPKAKQALENLQDDRGISGDMRAKISGLCRKMGKARTYIAMQLIVGIIRPCELAAKALQGSNMTAMMASLSCIQLLRTQLEKTRNGGLLTELKEATHQAEGLGLTVQQPRKTKTPARVRHTDASAVDEVRDPFQEVRIATLEALDLMMSALDHRFDTAGLKLAARREEVLLKIICEHQSTSEIAKHLQELKLPPTIDIETLKTQLSVFAGAFTETPKSTKDVAECLGKMDAVGRIMVPEVTKFISLILSVPCSVASAERSFSMLRRLKNYLRNSMGQARLTHLALMAAHKEKLRAMDMRQLMREFVKKTPERRLRFGNV